MQVMEIHSILNTNEAILGPDGKVFTFKSDINNTSARKLICTVCNLKFATKKTLTHHVKYKHNDTRLIYICPNCKDSFANAWCVFRHLYKVHRKTTAQIRRMRDQIHSSAIIKKQEPIKKKTSTVLETENDAEQDFQCCEGCGKRFDRKAALHSHTQMCLKRLALNAERESQKQSQDKQKTAVRRGSSKRKPDISQRLVRRCNLQSDVSAEASKASNEDKTAVVEDTVYHRHLIREIILGSRGSSDSSSSLDKKFIGFVSDEEEILGFVKGSDILMTPTNKSINEKTNQGETNDRLTPEDKVDAPAVKVEETTILPLFAQKVDISSDSGETDIKISLDESKTTQKDPENTFRKNSIPRQYSSRKNKTTAVTKLTDMDNLNLLPSNQNKNESPLNVILFNNNANTTEIDLPYDIQNDEIVSTVDCDVSDNNETLSVCSSDSDSCSCFDEKSSGSRGSSSGTVIPKIVFEENFTGNETDMKEISDLEQNSNGDKEIIGETIEIISDFEEFDENNKGNQCETVTIEQNVDNVDSTDSGKSSTVELIGLLDEYLVENQMEMTKCSTENDSEEIIGNLGRKGDDISDTIEINSDSDEINDKNRCKTPIIESEQNEKDITEESSVNTKEISENFVHNLDQNKKNVIEVDNVPLKENIKQKLNDVNEEIRHKSDISMPGDNSGRHLVSNKENNIDATNTCSRKRKHSDVESTLSDSPENSLREQCENYVDWDTLSCQSCSNSFETTEKLLEHMALHFNWLQYECMNCNFMCYDKNTCKQHLCHANTETESPDKRILALPLWRTMSMSRPFTNITPRSDRLDDPIEDDDSETDEEESTLTCNANEIKTQDPSLRKMIMEVIFGPQDAAKEPEMPPNSTRPIRNRRSIRSVQKDFEYDMKQIDPKVRKTKNKIKPIKIVKDSDLNFQVVTVTSEENKKKRTNN